MKSFELPKILLKIKELIHISVEIVRSEDKSNFRTVNINLKNMTSFNKFLNEPVILTGIEYINE